MSRRTIIILIIILEAVLLAAAISLLGVLHWREANTPTTQTTTAAPTTTVPPTTAEAATVPETTVPPTTTEPEPEPTVYTLSFAGDCTLGNFKGDYGSAGSFINIVGDDYDYPFANVLPYFENDDFTMVNFEGTLTDSTEAVDKTFNFHGPPAYARIVTAGSIEAVSLSNNHTYDYGAVGYADTISALEAEGILYAETKGTYLYTTESGLTIGIYANSFYYDPADMSQKLASLRQDGAEIIVVSMHWGVERTYTPTEDQQYYARTAIDAGADIVFGHHPHVLQTVEKYNGGIIYYSLGNFSFGGNQAPSDMDTAILQQQVIREADGTVHLGELTVIPCSISSEDYVNNYQPTPLEPASDRYLRVFSKLALTPDMPEPDATAEPSSEPTASDETTEGTSASTAETAPTEGSG